MNSKVLSQKIQRQDDFYDFPYHWAYQKNNQRLYQLRTELTLTLLAQAKAKEVLDFGCGDARFSADLVQNGYQKVCGVDISSRALRFAHCLVPEAEFKLLNGDQIPYEDHSFEAVVALDVIEHIPDAELAKWTNEIYRVLKPQGYFIVSVPSTRIPVGKTHFRHYGPEDLESYLGQQFSPRQMLAYFLKPWWMSNLLYGFYNFDGLWKLYRPLLRKCALNQGIYLLASAQKVVQ